LGNLAGGEAYDQQSTVLGKAPQGVGEPVTAHRVDDEVHRTALEDRFLESLRQDVLVRSG